MKKTQKNIRARDLGIPFDGTPGLHNAITDVKGVEVGQATLIRGGGKLRIGKGPVRTGVTAVLPKGKNPLSKVFAGWFSLNGAGELTGTAWIDEGGLFQGPVMITNTHSVGVVRDAVIEWTVRHHPKLNPAFDFFLPVVGETWDGLLNDVNGFHVKKEDVFKAINSAKAGPVAEGNVGGGTGMVCHEFKGGNGTASRRLSKKDGGYTVGVLVQANYGKRPLLRFGGVQVGKEIPDLMPKINTKPVDGGSIIIVIATDAPLLPHQLKRVAKRAALGLARNGAIAANRSGDIFVAFSTANPDAGKEKGIAKVRMLPEDLINPVFLATVQAVEEAVINALVAARTMTGIDGNTIYALPHDRIRALMGRPGGSPVHARERSGKAQGLAYVV